MFLHLFNNIHSFNKIHLFDQIHESLLTNDIFILSAFINTISVSLFNGIPIFGGYLMPNPSL